MGHCDADPGMRGFGPFVPLGHRARVLGGGRENLFHCWWSCFFRVKPVRDEDLCCNVGRKGWRGQGCVFPGIEHPANHLARKRNLMDSRPVREPQVGCECKKRIILMAVL